MSTSRFAQVIRGCFASICWAVGVGSIVWLLTDYAWSDRHLSSVASLATGVAVALPSIRRAYERSSIRDGLFAQCVDELEQVLPFIYLGVPWSLDATGTNPPLLAKKQRDHGSPNNKMQPEHIQAKQLPIVSWANGTGHKRVLALATDGTNPVWRICLANIAQDSSFSFLPGIDRCVALTHGNGFTLEFREAPQRREVRSLLTPLFFEGEQAPRAEVVAGPVTNLSITVARGSGRIDFAQINAGQRFEPGPTTMIYCSQGHAVVRTEGGSFEIGGSEALLWRVCAPEVCVEHASDDAELAHIRIVPLAVEA